MPESQRPSRATTSSTPTPTRGVFGADDIAQVVTTDLVIRSAPGVGPSSEIHPTALDAPALVYVIGGPVASDGYDWYEVIPANLDYLPNGYAASGWVAAASRDGERWIGDLDAACPGPASLLAVVSLSELGTIACFGSQTVTFEGTFAGCQDRPAGEVFFVGGWEFDTSCVVTPDGLDPDLIPNPGSLVVHLDHGVAADDATIGSRVRVTGHFDDAGARSCSSDGDAFVPPQMAVVLCRAQFVGVEITIVAEPSS